MRDRYDGVRGKEARTEKSRQTRLEGEHNSNDAFVKKIQAEQAKYAGKNPNMKPEMMKLNATMSNTGEYAQECARNLTKGIDHAAFPVK